jgi:hypothetical protein
MATRDSRTVRQHFGKRHPFENKHEKGDTDAESILPHRRLFHAEAAIILRLFGSIQSQSNDRSVTEDD